MSDLQHHRGTFGVDVIGQTAQPVDDFRAVQYQVAAEGGWTVTRNHGGSDHRQSATSLCLFDMVKTVAVLGHALLAIGRLVRGADDAVAQRQVLDLERFKKWVGL